MIKKLFKYSIDVIALACLFFAIRWSDYPCIKIGFIEKLFVHVESVVSSMLNIVTGYLTGYFVYLLTVEFPEKKRKTPIQNLVYKKLSNYVNKSMYLLLLMCKNFSTREEFHCILSDTDVKCFDKQFLCNMSRFDICKPADTPLLHKDSQERLTWFEYLDERYKGFNEEIRDIYLRYHTYLDDETVMLLERIIESSFIDVFVGKGSNFNTCYAGKNGVKYYEDIPISIVYAGNPDLNRFFRFVDGNPSPLLVDYIEMLKDLTVFLEARYTSYNKTFAVDLFSDEKVGSFMKK